MRQTWISGGARQGPPPAQVCCNLPVNGYTIPAEEDTPPARCRVGFKLFPESKSFANQQKFPPNQKHFTELKVIFTESKSFTQSTSFPPNQNRLTKIIVTKSKIKIIFTKSKSFARDQFYFPNQNLLTKIEIFLPGYRFGADPVKRYGVPHPYPLHSLWHASPG